MKIPDHLEDVFNDVCMLSAIKAPDDIITNLLDNEEAIKNRKERELILAGKAEVFHILDNIQSEINHILDAEEEDDVFEAKILNLIEQQQAPEVLTEQIYSASIVSYAHSKLYTSLSEMIKNGASEAQVIAYFKEQQISDEILESLAFIYSSVLLELKSKGIAFPSEVQNGSPKLVIASGIMVLIIFLVTFIQGAIDTEYSLVLFLIGALITIYGFRMKARS